MSSKKLVLLITQASTLYWSSTHLISLTFAQLNSYLSARTLRNSRISELKYSVCLQILISRISLGPKLQEIKVVSAKSTTLFLLILVRECPGITESSSKKKMMLCMEPHSEVSSSSMELTKSDQFKLTMTPLEDPLKKHLDSFKDSNLLISTEKYAQLTGNQAMQPLSQIKRRRRNSFLKHTKLANYEELINLNVSI